MVPSTLVPFIFSSSLSHKIRFSSCTSCCINASAESHLRAVVVVVL
jgi:hypothetical protein